MKGQPLRCAAHTPNRRVAPSTRVLSTLAVVTLVLIVTACGSPDDKEILEVTVGSELKECVVVGPMQCMVVDGNLFYDRIDGFDFVQGYVYRLKIERYDAWPDEEEPPQDASKYGYRLIETISKTPAE